MSGSCSASQRAVELAQQLHAEAGGERAARQIDDIADAFQADARQPGDGCGRKPQRGQRQRRQKAALLAIEVIPRLAMMRGGPCGADAAGDRERKSKAGGFQPAAEIGDQFLLAAVKMRAAANVEQQTVGRIASHQRRVAQAPVGDALEQRGVGLGVFLDRFQRGMHGARLRQRHAGLGAQSLRRVIDGGEQFGITALAVDDCCVIPPPKGEG